MTFSFEPAAETTLSEAPRGPGLLSLLVWIWIRPRRALEGVRAGRTWLFVVPLLIAVIVFSLNGIVQAPLQAEIAHQENLARLREQIPPAEFENLPPEMLVTPPGQPVVLTLLVALGPLLLAWFIRPAVLHILGLLVGGQDSYAILLRTTAWASFPLILRALLQTIFAGLTQQPIVGSGLSGLVEPGMLAAILGQIDLFSLWYVILLGLAVAVSSRLGRNKALLVTAIYVILVLLLNVGAALLSNALTGGTSGFVS
jgi:uncharacterized membrane protein YhaH (DUF805 family)